MNHNLKYAALKYHQARDYLVEPGTIHERLVKAISVVAQVGVTEFPDSFQPDVLTLIQVIGPETWQKARAGEHIESYVRCMNLFECQACTKALVRVGENIDKQFPIRG